MIVGKPLAEGQDGTFIYPAKLNNNAESKEEFAIKTIPSND